MIKFILSVPIVLIVLLGMLTIGITLFNHFRKDQELSKDRLRMIVLIMIVGVSIFIDKAIYLWRIDYQIIPLIADNLK